MLKIVILDTGVKTDHEAFKDDTINGFGIHRKQIIENFYDTNGHGTAIYGIIRNSKSTCEILNIKVLFDEVVDEDDLIWALTYILNEVECDIINMSLGLSICENIVEFKDVCEKLKNRGTILISAFDNTGSFSYPALFDSVVGVTNDSKCKRVDQISCFENSPINLGGYGSLQRLIWTDPEYVFLSGNSFACAHVTNLIIKIIQESGKSDIKSSLKKKCIYSYNYDNYILAQKVPFHISRSVLFPFAKEMHSLIRYSDLLDFSIVDIYDVKYSGKVGASSNLLLNEKLENNYEIKNIESIDWESFDTIILGHMDQIERIIGKQFVDNLVGELIRRKKSIYSFDNLPIDSSTIYTPAVYKSNVPPSYFGKLYRFSKPILCICGTSSQQGKFTLQLELRRRFQNSGYNVGQIGTEPSSLLYGMDYVFPMGYNSQVFCQEYDTIRYINYVINSMCCDEKDIILAGSQSGTIPYDYGNLEMLLVQQFLFLEGCMPDAVLLCINPYDELQYIKRTIDFIEASVDTKVIGLIVFPMDWAFINMNSHGGKRKLSDERYFEIKNILESAFSLPVYKLGEEESMNSLFNDLLEYFSNP